MLLLIANQTLPDKDAGEATPVTAGYGSMDHSQLMIFDAIIKNCWSSGVASTGSGLCANIASTKDGPTVKLIGKGIFYFPKILCGSSHGVLLITVQYWFNI